MTSRNWNARLNELRQLTASLRDDNNNNSYRSGFIIGNNL